MEWQAIAAVVGVTIGSGMGRVNWVARPMEEVGGGSG